MKRIYSTILVILLVAGLNFASVPKVNASGWDKVIGVPGLTFGLTKFAFGAVALLKYAGLNAELVFFNLFENKYSGQIALIKRQIDAQKRSFSEQAIPNLTYGAAFTLMSYRLLKK